MNHSVKANQRERVLQYMLANGSINGLQAITDIAVVRLASRISEMKKRGFQIDGKMIPVKNRYGETCYIKKYWLEHSSETHSTV